MTCQGRDTELAALAELVDTVTSGRYVGVLVEGVPGIGKSRLLSVHSADQRALGRRLATGVAEEFDRARPFGLIAGALDCTPTATDPRRRELAGLLSDESSTVSSDAGLHFRVVDRFLDLIEDLAMSEPLVLVLDDLQWADPSSLLVLGAVGRRFADLPIALVGGIRTGESSAETRQFRTALEGAGGQSLTLRPLREHDVRALVTDVLAAEPGPKLMSTVGGAAGNPLFVHELLAAIQAEGTLSIADGVIDMPELALPGGLRETILQRIGFLPETTLVLLRHASILGTGFDLGDLSVVTGRAVVDLVPALEPAFGAGFLIDAGTAVRFGHDLVRRATYLSLPESIRTGLHREAAQRLADAGSPAIRVAEHYRRSAQPGDLVAVEWLTRASRRSGDLAPATSADLLQQAVDLLAPGDPSASQLRAERAGRLLWAGRIPEAEAECRILLREGNRSIEGQVRALLGRCMMADGRMAEAATVLEAAERSAGASDGVRLLSLASAGVAHLFAGRMSEAREAAAGAQAIAQTSEEPDHRARALTTSAAVELFQGNLTLALQLSGHAVTEAKASPAQQGHRDLHHLVRGHVLMELDRPADAHATLEAGMRLCENLGFLWSLGAYRLMIAVAHFHAGDWDLALAAIDDGEELSAETGENYNVIAGQCVRGLIALHRNDLTTAGSSRDAAARELERAGPRWHHHWVAWLDALLLEADGDHRGAHARLRAAWEDLVASGMVVEYAAIAPDLIRLGEVVGETQSGADVLAEIESAADRHEIPALRAARWHCRGLLDDDPDSLCTAVAAYAEGPRRLEHALAAEEAGVAWGHRNEREKAVDLLERAIDGFEELGATRDVSRTLAELRAIGVHRRGRSPRGQQRTGWQSLTPAERRVVDLVVDGLTNPEIGERLFVSRRTVQTHLSHVFQKLDLSSRSELAAEAVRRQG